MCCLASAVSCPVLGLRVSVLDPREKSWRREGLIESRSDLVSDHACAESSAEGAGLGRFLLWVGRHLTGGHQNQLWLALCLLQEMSPARDGRRWGCLSVLESVCGWKKGAQITQ